MAQIKDFFIPRDKFDDGDWILKHQIFALLIISFGLGIGIFLFAIYRVTHGHIVAGAAQFIVPNTLVQNYALSVQGFSFYKYSRS